MDLATVTCEDRPVCGCDGAIYETNCAALQAGVFITSASQCETPEGMTECLDVYCDAVTEYCDVRRHYGPSQFPVPCDQGPAFSSGACHELPADCGDSGCSCISDEPFANCPGTPSCSDTVDGPMRSCLSGCYG